MPIRYRTLGEHRRLSSIVFAGSHDASISSGWGHAKTQDKTIKEQAQCGVRIFDLRILMSGSKKKGFSLRGYHGSTFGKSKFKGRSSHTGGTYDVEAIKGFKLGGVGGTTGEKLSDMLIGAKSFVRDTGEFLILKFDKCKNYELIADYCTNILGKHIYTASLGRELGARSIGSLGGHVICVFGDDAYQELSKQGMDHTVGIHGFRNLKGKDGVKSYSAGYTGLQYFGKGGTDVKRVYTHGMKITENYKRQKKLMAKMAVANEPQARDVLGMMYWTTTGIFANIKSRNDQMWQEGKHFWQRNNKGRLEKLWTHGLEASIAHNLDAEEITYVDDPKLGERMRAFFPNIIMIDFADNNKCETIFELNKTANKLLTEAFKTYVS